MELWDDLPNEYRLFILSQIRNLNPLIFFKWISTMPTFLYGLLVILSTFWIIGFFWVWIVDILVVEFDASDLWEVVWPNHGKLSFEDYWIKTNTWIIHFVTIAVMKLENVDHIDWSVPKQRILFILLSHFLLSEMFIPAKYVTLIMWIPQVIAFALFPQVFVD